MKNKKELIIDKYSQPIFIPNDLYVIKNFSLEDITKLFVWSDGVEITEDDIGLNKSQAVALANCYRKDDKDRRLCTLILINKIDKDRLINTVAHESMHITQDILEYCGIPLTRDSSEIYAFTIGWVAECMYNTAKK